ncbi:MAG: hypothetical protein WBV59_23715 [Anaerolineae bacterium]
MTGRTVGGVTYTLVYDAQKVRRGEAVIGSNTTVYVGAIYEKMTSGISTAGMWAKASSNALA